MVGHAARPRGQHHLRRPWAPHPLVGRERRDRVARRRGERVREHRPVLKRLARALSQVGQHRVRRVAEQRDPPRRPPGDRVPVVERPLVPGLARLEQPQQRRVPVRVPLGDLGPLAPRHPGLVPVGVVVVVRDHVDQLLAAQRVEHDRAVRTEPLPEVGRHVGQRAAAHRRRRDDRPVADLPGEPGRVRPEQRGPDGGVDAVRADDHVRLGFGAVGEPRDRRIPAAVHRDAPLAERHQAGQAARRRARRAGPRGARWPARCPAVPPSAPGSSWR